MEWEQSHRDSENGVHHAETIKTVHKPSAQQNPTVAWRWRKYLAALRPWSFTASLTPVLLGTSLAYKSQAVFNMPIVLVVCVTALAVHAAGNLVNTYYDYERGVDSINSDDRTLVERRMDPNDVATLGAVCYAIGCVGLAVLCYLSPAKVQLLALVYFCGLSGSFLYTGGLGLKYLALGDIVIFLTFGPLTVLFAFLACTGQLSLTIIPYAVPLAMNIECILHANNCRDRTEDNKAGIVTLAILIGQNFSYVLFCFLLFGPFLVFTFMTMHFSGWFFLPSSAVIFTFSIERDFRSGHLAKLPHRLALLNLILGLCFIIAICMTHPSKLPFLAAV